MTGESAGQEFVTAALDREEGVLWQQEALPPPVLSRLTHQLACEDWPPRFPMSFTSPPRRHSSLVAAVATADPSTTRGLLRLRRRQPPLLSPPSGYRIVGGPWRTPRLCSAPPPVNEYESK